MIPKRSILIALILILVAGSGTAGDKKKFSFRRNKGFVTDTCELALENGRFYRQGCSMKVWFTNVYGMIGSPGLLPPDPCARWGISWDYPAGACVEHLSNAGPITISEGVHPGHSELVESESSKSTPRVANSASLA